MRSFDDMNRLFREMDRTFDQFRASWWNEFATPALETGRPALQAPGTETGPGLEGHGDPAFNLEDEGEEYVFVMDLPGFEKEDIDLTYDDGVLSVRASRDVEDGSDGYRSMQSRRIARQLAIPKEIVAEEITATYRNGVLEANLPIVEGERDTGHRIDIE